MKPRTRSWDASPEASAYRQQYRSEHYDKLSFDFPPGTKELLAEAADAAGMSRTQYVLAAITEKIDREKKG